jgi:predicted acetyltransferase
VEIRPIKPAERIQLSKIQGIAFLFTQDFSEYEQNPEKFEKGYETGRAAFDDSGKMCSGLELIPYHVRFDGNTVPMGGIGGVASLPEERKKRYIRKVFEYCTEEMYEKGVVFSYLYPFSHEYYRKFGYELNLTGIECAVPFSSLSHFRQTGDVRMFVPGMETSDIISVYRQFIQDKNLSVVREQKHWERFFGKDPFKTNIFLYVWYDGEGVAKGYFQYSVERNEKNRQEQNMKIHEFIWLNGEAFAGMLAFLNGFYPQFRNLFLRLPHFADILSFFPEPYKVEQHIRTQGMNRVVNVRKALQLMKAPSGSGEAVIEVEDPFFPRNSGRYLVVWEDGKSGVAESDREPDMICSVNDLSQLITGFATVSQLHTAGRIEAKRGFDRLDKLFAKKKLFLNDHF